MVVFGLFVSLSWYPMWMRWLLCLCLARGGVGGEGGEWMRGLGLDFTNSVGTGEVLDVCLYFSCGGGEWVGGLDQGLEGWGGVMSV